MAKIELITGKDDKGRRLDRILRKALPEHSLSLIHRLLRQGKILVNGMPGRPDMRIQQNAIIQLHIKIPRNFPKKNIARNCGIKMPCIKMPGILMPCLKMPSIIWHYSGVIFFNKPSGLAAHGKNSLDSIVKTWLKETLPPSLSFKPGPLHRLDRYTSGVIAFSENLDGAMAFTNLLMEQCLKKKYLAIVEGRLEKEQLWQNDIVRDKAMRKSFVSEDLFAGRLFGTDEKAKNAISSVCPIASNGTYSLIEVTITTGRTHQIRVQAACHGHPLAADIKYGGHPFSEKTNFYLHSWKIEFPANQSLFPREITAPLPQAFLEKTRHLFGREFP